MNAQLETEYFYCTGKCCFIYFLFLLHDENNKNQLNLEAGDCTRRILLIVVES